MNKETNGHIKIDFSNGSSNDVIMCCIEDDGIGRKKADEIKKDLRSKHKSLGLQVTKERLDLLNKQFKSDIYVNIIDLVNDEGIGIGTKVELSIPYEVEKY